jgi:hypothetical protein
MTGNDIIQSGLVRLGESLSTGAQQQSMLWPDHVRWAANRLARDTWCLYRLASTDILMGQGVYKMPKRPFRAMAVLVKDDNGNIWPISGITAEQADSLYYNWRASPGSSPPAGLPSTSVPQIYQGVPVQYIDDTLDTLCLIPIPNYGAQDGLMVAGYYGVDKWWDMNDECPLPDGHQQAVITGACWQRCEEMLMIDPRYAAVLPRYQSRFESEKRDLYRECVGAIEARRGQVPSMGKRMGAYGLGWGFWGVA